MILSILILALSFQTWALELKFIGPCDEDFVLKVQVEEVYPNVGELTVATLKKWKIPFQGSPEGINSVFLTPTGEQALEIISPNEMRAYGWCYSIDGIAPEVYPHETPVYSHSNSIVWHYGFARFYNGQWVTQCTPAHTVKPKFLCED